MESEKVTPKNESTEVQIYAVARLLRKQHPTTKKVFYELDK
jgi:hypothetical protein